MLRINVHLSALNIVLSTSYPATPALANSVVVDRTQDEAELNSLTNCTVHLAYIRKLSQDV